MAAPAPLFRLVDVTVGYGAVPVLTGIDITIEPGEFWFLVGPNGAGKSTLLRLLTGALPPRSGRIERHPELARPDRMGVIPQRTDVAHTLPTTVCEFVRLGLVGTGPGVREEERLRAALAETGLAGLEDASYWSLSGGQRQRAVVARALIRNPTVLLVDEPAAGLDLRAERDLLRLLAERNRSDGTTILYVSHDLRPALTLASHVAVVANGRVRAGPASDLLREPVLREAYGVAVRLFRTEDGTPVVDMGGIEA